jgi:hypothetical protein
MELPEIVFKSLSFLLWYLDNMHNVHPRSTMYLGYLFSRIQLGRL